MQIKHTTLELNKKIGQKCEIYCGYGAIEKVIPYLKSHKAGNKYAIITDSKVEKLHGIWLSKSLREQGIENQIFSFPEGEKQKTLATVFKLSEDMIAAGFDRKDAIIALGGGVTGDMAGLLASIYMRGIPFIQIPTTLMAMADSSIGGKTGVDTPSGKNLLGTFYQPKAIFSDPTYLETLAKKHITNGLAEIIKYGVIQDLELFNFLEQNIERILSLEKEDLEHIIQKSIDIKSQIVMEDEQEHGKRMILNYGHTFGHAIEKMSGYTLLHGHAVAIGINLANKRAVELGLLHIADADRIKNLLKRAGLPITTMHKPTTKDIRADKKKDGNYINLILPTAIGQVTIYKEQC